MYECWKFRPIITYYVLKSMYTIHKILFMGKKLSIPGLVLACKKSVTSSSSSFSCTKVSILWTFQFPRQSEMDALFSWKEEELKHCYMWNHTVEETQSLENIVRKKVVLIRNWKSNLVQNCICFGCNWVCIAALLLDSNEKDFCHFKR